MDIKRILANCAPLNERGCLIWEGNINNWGYPRAWEDGITLAIHREMYKLCNGPIPTGLVVMHTCDNTKCIQPEHLKLGTQQDNQTDKILKQRQARGDQHGRSTLTATQVVTIRKEYKSGMSLCALAKQHNVTKSTIHTIVKYKTWQHLS
jgi:hypothetical protein